MAVKIISDIHGAYDALSEQLDPDDTAVLLGDYVNLIDFRTLEGILSEVYSREEIIEVLTILARGRDESTMHRIRDAASGSPEKFARVRQLIAESYQAFFASIPCRCFSIFGNTDDPSMMREISDGRVEIIEVGVADIEGQRFGFVSGSPRGPWTIGLPGEMETDRYESLVASLGPVDVLCTHYPPAIPELTWDRLANRDEAGSDALVTYIDDHAPEQHYFGHVHNPRAATALRGSTRLVNAGFFKQHKTALVHDG